MKTIVGLCGKKGAGKDTFAQILIERYGFTRIAFADALYREVQKAFNVHGAVLSNRVTKETGLESLALANCSDEYFVSVAIEHLKKLDETREETLSSPRSPRVIMQLWGTEYRRMCFGDSYWRDKVTAKIDATADGAKLVVTDVRFLDEATTVESYGGRILRIVRPNQALSIEAQNTLNHPSEVEIDGYTKALCVLNPENNPGSMNAVADELFSDVGAVAR